MNAAAVMEAVGSPTSFPRRDEPARVLRVAQVITRLSAGAGGVALRGALALDPARYESTILTSDSSDLIEDAVDMKHVDVLFAGISGRRFTKNYFHRIIRTIEPKLIVPHHYDNFFVPLGEPTKFSFNVNLTGFADEVRAVTREVPMHTLEVGVPVVGT